MSNHPSANSPPYFMSIRDEQRHECFIKYKNALELFRLMEKDSFTTGSPKPERFQEFCSYLLAIYFDIRPALATNPDLFTPLAALDSKTREAKPRFDFLEAKEFFFSLRTALDKLSYFD